MSYVIFTNRAAGKVRPALFNGKIHANALTLGNVMHGERSPIAAGVSPVCTVYVQ